MSALPNIVLPERLRGLIQHCERACVAGCCGINAYDFSPLHIASYISTYTGVIIDNDFTEWDAELDRASALIDGLPPDSDGMVCVIEEMNQSFSEEDYYQMLFEIQHSIRMGPEILDLSRRLKYTKQTIYDAT